MTDRAVPEPGPAVGQSANVVAVVAAFHPDEKFVARVSDVRRQVAHVIVVDDGSGSCDAEALAPFAQLISLNSNSGIAHAFNVGIEEATRGHSAQFVLTLDQDTSLSDGYVRTALATFIRAQKDGLRVGAVAASLMNGLPTNSRALKKRGFVELFDPIQSGTLYCARTFQGIGLLDESLFIDAVDTEYSLRMSANGLHVISAPACELTHELGEAIPASVFGRLLRVAGRSFFVLYHPPFRTYYMARNNIIVARRYALKLPVLVARRECTELFHSVVGLVFGRNRRLAIRAILFGVAHGIRRQGGRIPAEVEARLSTR